MGPVRQNPIQTTVSLFICVCIALCTIVGHNIAQNRPDNFPSYPPDNHCCSDDVYLRKGGGTGTQHLHCVYTQAHNTCIMYTHRYTTPALGTQTGTQHLYYVHTQVHNTCTGYTDRYTTPVLCTQSGTQHL